MRRAGQLQRRRGTTSLVALITISTLAFIGGSFIVRITNRSREGYQSASWIEASQMAESGAAVALAEIRRVLPTANTLPTNCWAGWTATTTTTTGTTTTTVAAALPVTRLIPLDTTLTLAGLSLAHVGEGNTTTTGTVAVDAPASLVDPAGQQWYRIRATGTASLPGGVRVSFSAVDRQMRRLSFVTWSNGTPLIQPHVTRTVECIVQPVPHFGAALLAGGQISSVNPATIDSFDSTDATKSTAGRYDSLKRQRNGSVYTNGSSLGLAGNIMGNLGTNGATLPSGLTVSGTTDSSNYRTLAPVSTPDWGAALNGVATPVTKKKATKLTTGTMAVPTTYHLGTVSGPLTLSANQVKGNTVPSKVILWVDGDITSTITVENGVQAIIYLNGSMTVNSTDLVNPSQQAANLQIYGVQSSSTRNITVTMSGEVDAAIYAPSHAVALSGTADWMGAITAASIQLKGNDQIHYDESLAHSAALIVDYQLASWIEDVH